MFEQMRHRTSNLTIFPPEACKANNTAIAGINSCSKPWHFFFLPIVGCVVSGTWQLQAHQTYGSWTTSWQPYFQEPYHVQALGPPSGLSCRLGSALASHQTLHSRFMAFDFLWFAYTQTSVPGFARRHCFDLKARSTVASISWWKWAARKKIIPYQTPEYAACYDSEVLSKKPIFKVWSKLQKQRGNTFPHSLEIFQAIKGCWGLILAVHE